VLYQSDAKCPVIIRQLKRRASAKKSAQSLQEVTAGTPE
jgi:hypothetical protein